MCHKIQVGLETTGIVSFRLLLDRRSASSTEYEESVLNRIDVSPR